MPKLTVCFLHACYLDQAPKAITLDRNLCISCGQTKQHISLHVLNLVLDTPFCVLKANIDMYIIRHTTGLYLISKVYTWVSMCVDKTVTRRRYVTVVRTRGLNMKSNVCIYHPLVRTSYSTWNIKRFSANDKFH